MSVINTLRPKGVPAHAVARTYTADGGKTGTYYTWLVGTEWYWEVQGNNGKSRTEAEAADKCRWWIKCAQ